MVFHVLRFYLFIFRERRKEGEREGEKHQCMVASRVAPSGDVTGCSQEGAPNRDL